MGVKCFYVEPTNMVALWLRRYSDSDKDAKCPLPYSYHNAMVRIEDAPALTTPEGYLQSRDPPMDDTRWPTKCECGYEFTPKDHWQLFQDSIYSNGITMRDQPPGAMYNAFWMPKKRRGPDGLALVVVLPDGQVWHIDGPSSSGGGWERTGTPPNITARPSILTSKYHGWLTDGELVEC